jgi:hypothetical protein
LIALQWARGAKWFSLQVLQWAQGVKEDWVCESKKLKCHVFWFGCEPECLNCLLCLCEENLDVGVCVHVNLIFMCGCEPGRVFMNLNVSVYDNLDVVDLMLLWMFFQVCLSYYLGANNWCKNKSVCTLCK